MYQQSGTRFFALSPRRRNATEKSEGECRFGEDQMKRMTCLHLRDTLPSLGHILQLKIFTHRLSLEGLVCGPG